MNRFGPEARLRDAAEGMGALGRVAQNLPQLLRNAETVSTMLADGGLRLHPDTARQIAQAQMDRSRPTRIVLWVAGALGAAATFWWIV